MGKSPTAKGIVPKRPNDKSPRGLIALQRYDDFFILLFHKMRHNFHFLHKSFVLVLFYLSFGGALLFLYAYRAIVRIVCRCSKGDAREMRGTSEGVLSCYDEKQMQCNIAICEC